MYDTPNRELAASNQGRWLSPDPAGSGWNQMLTRPTRTSLVDRSGLFRQFTCGGCFMSSGGRTLSGDAWATLGMGSGNGFITSVHTAAQFWLTEQSQLSNKFPPLHSSAVAPMMSLQEYWGALLLLSQRGFLARCRSLVGFPLSK